VAYVGHLFFFFCGERGEWFASLFVTFFNREVTLPLALLDQFGS
jgi:hypothetical protein